MSNPFDIPIPEAFADAVTLWDKAYRVKRPTGVDDCELCEGKRGGTPGNENVICGVVVCDYCHMDSALIKYIPPQQKMRERLELRQKLAKHFDDPLADKNKARVLNGAADVQYRIAERLLYSSDNVELAMSHYLMSEALSEAASILLGTYAVLRDE